MTSCSTRVCADERCGKPLPTDADPRARYCSRKCLRRVSARVAARARSKTGSTNRQPAFIRRLREAVPEGRCVYCEGELARRQRFMCAKEACRTAYRADHRRELRHLEKGTSGEDGAECLAAEAVVDLRAGTVRLAVQVDAFRGRVREFCASVLGDAR